jgi:antitoxin component of MazEF toxin-antitoxin module
MRCITKLSQLSTGILRSLLFTNTIPFDCCLVFILIAKKFNFTCEMLEDGKKEKVAHIVHGNVLEGQQDSLTTIRNLLCSSYATSRTVKKEFESQLLIKKEQAEFLIKYCISHNLFLKTVHSNYKLIILDTMKTSLIQIGSSKGIRIPDSLVEKYQLRGDIELIPSKNGLLIRSSSKPRLGWEDAFKKSAEREKESDSSQWQSFSNTFDKEEWSW